MSPIDDNKYSFPSQEDNHNNTVPPEEASIVLPAWKVESTIANLILAAVTIVHVGDQNFNLDLVD